MNITNSIFKLIFTTLVFIFSIYIISLGVTGKFDNNSSQTPYIFIGDKDRKLSIAAGVLAIIMCFCNYYLIFKSQ
jgi:hypothetical protein